MEQRLRLVQGGGVRVEKRGVDRVPMRVPGQIIWKDAQGRTHAAAVTTADVSRFGVRIETRGSLTLPLYRLVYFQIDRHARDRADVPDCLRKQTVLAAVFRVGATSQVTGTPTEYALRFMVEPPAAQKPLTWGRRRGERTRTA